MDRQTDNGISWAAFAASWQYYHTATEWPKKVCIVASVQGAVTRLNICQILKWNVLKLEFLHSCVYTYGYLQYSYLPESWLSWKSFSLWACMEGGVAFSVIGHSNSQHSPEPGISADFIRVPRFVIRAQESKETWGSNLKLCDTCCVSCCTRVQKF